MRRIFTLITAANLNRFGMVLTFFSFWFAAPELLGQRRLILMRDSIGEGIRMLPKTVSGVVFWFIVYVPVLVGWFYIYVYWLDYFSWSFGQRVLGSLIEHVVGFVLFVIGLIAYYAVFDLTTKYVAGPLLASLADNKRLRRNSLSLGALLFVFGFILQLVSTFIS